MPDGPCTVKRFLRILRNSATLLSFALCILTIVLSVRSCWRQDNILISWTTAQSLAPSRFKISGHELLLGTAGGGFWINWDYWQSIFGEFPTNPFYLPHPTTIGYKSNPSIPLRLQSLYRIRYYSPGDTPGRRQFDLRIPFIFPMVIFALPPALMLMSLRRRRKTGHCPHCGYDLRASPERCPECGKATSSIGQPSTSTAR